MRTNPCEKALRWLQERFRARNLMRGRRRLRRLPYDLSCDLRRDIGLPCLPDDPSPQYRNLQ
ncbi:hypothetical protein [Breoghania sp.]|uniref:hypothetical protein n=1 Tax=Breoghania sp. TaxID=2065378 RepID=UPI002AA630A9|nr:hypothetical protein [Breoghania sp.]